MALQPAQQTLLPNSPTQQPWQPWLLPRLAGGLFVPQAGLSGLDPCSSADCREWLCSVLG